jgi:hypothetical protein
MAFESCDGIFKPGGHHNLFDTGLITCASTPNQFSLSEAGAQIIIEAE